MSGVPVDRLTLSRLSLSVTRTTDITKVIFTTTTEEVVQKENNTTAGMEHLIAVLI